MGYGDSITRQSFRSAFIASTGFWSSYFLIYWISAQTYYVSTTYWWLNYFAFLSLALFAIGVFHISASPSKGKPASDWVLAGVMSLSMMLLFALTAEGYSGLLVAPLFMLLGIANGWLFVRWGLLYAQKSAANVLLALLLGIVMVSLIKIVFVSAPQTLVMLFAVLTPWVSMTMLRHALDIQKETSTTIWFNRKTKRLFWRDAIAVATLMFIWSFFNMLLKTNTGHYGFGVAISPCFLIVAQVLDICFACLLFLWVFWHKGSLDFTQLWCSAYVGIALCLLMIAWLGVVQEVQVLISAVFEIATMLILLTLANIAHHSTLHPYTIFGVGYLLYTIPEWIGRSVVRFFGITAIDNLMVIALLFVIIVIIAFFLQGKSHGAQLLLADLHGVTLVIEDYQLLEQRCKMIGESKGLSTREIEVVCFLCKGRSKSYIAETLYLSENTVRTYTRRIYQKLGIHNKQELLDIITPEVVTNSEH